MGDGRRETDNVSLVIGRLGRSLAGPTPPPRRRDLHPLRAGVWRCFVR